MKFQDIFWTTFIVIMVAALFVTVISGLSSLREDRDATIREIEQTEIAREECLSKGYDKLITSEHYYCSRLVNGNTELIQLEMRVK